MNVLVSQFQHFYYLYNGKKIETGLGERVKLHECQHFVCVCLCVCVCVCVCVCLTSILFQDMLFYFEYKRGKMGKFLEYNFS